MVKTAAVLIMVMSLMVIEIRAPGGCSVSRIEVSKFKLFPLSNTGDSTLATCNSNCNSICSWDTTICKKLDATGITYPFPVVQDTSATLIYKIFTCNGVRFVEIPDAQVSGLSDSSSTPSTTPNDCATTCAADPKCTAVTSEHSGSNYCYTFTQNRNLLFDGKVTGTSGRSVYIKMPSAHPCQPRFVCGGCGAEYTEYFHDSSNAYLNSGCTATPCIRGSHPAIYIGSKVVNGMWFKFKRNYPCCWRFDPSNQQPLYPLKRVKSCTRPRANGWF